MREKVANIPDCILACALAGTKGGTTAQRGGQSRIASALRLLCASFGLALLALLLAVASARALDFPALTGRVVDEAGILDSPTRAALTGKLAAFEEKTTDQLVV